MRVALEDEIARLLVEGEAPQVEIAGRANGEAIIRPDCAVLKKRSFSFF